MLWCSRRRIFPAFCLHSAPQRGKTPQDQQFTCVGARTHSLWILLSLWQIMTNSESLLRISVFHLRSSPDSMSPFVFSALSGHPGSQIWKELCFFWHFTGAWCYLQTLTICQQSSVENWRKHQGSLGKWSFFSQISCLANLSTSESDQRQWCKDTPALQNGLVPTGSNIQSCYLFSWVAFLDL